MPMTKQELIPLTTYGVRSRKYEAHRATITESEECSLLRYNAV
jgi:hypothetical protein